MEPAADPRLRVRRPRFADPHDWQGHEDALGDEAARTMSTLERLERLGLLVELAGMCGLLDASVIIGEAACDSLTGLPGQRSRSAGPIWR